jgi:hypothetical protein
MQNVQFPEASALSAPCPVRQCFPPAEAVPVNTGLFESNYHASAPSVQADFVQQLHVTSFFPIA